MVVKRAAALLCALSACLPDPHGRCATDADCAGGAAGSYCSAGICQGPPRGTLDALPSRAFSRAEMLHVVARVDRSHGAATARVVFGGAAVAMSAQPDGSLAVDVPLSLAPAGVEGAVPFSVELCDDLGHATALPGSVTVDDRAPRVAVDPATVPASAVVRGTQVSLRITAVDLTAVTVAGATRNSDGSFTLPVDTRTAPSAAVVFDVPITATDAVGNVAVVHASIPVTRLKFMVREPSNGQVEALVLSDNLIWGQVNQNEFWILDRATGAPSVRAPSGAIAFPEFATDGSRVFFARVDNMVCRMGADGAVQACCGPFATLKHGPILQGTTPIVGTTGTSTTSSRLFAIVETSPACGNSVGTTTLADFGATQPGIAPDGTIYSGALGAIVAAQFDGIGWNPRSTTESPHYQGAPAFRGNGAVLLSANAGTLDTYKFLDPLGSPAPAPTTTPVATGLQSVPSPTVAADGTAVFATDDPRLIALRPDNSIRWTVSLPAQATAPPSHGAGDLLYVGLLSGDILALHLADGSTAWDFPAGASVRGPLAPGCDGVLYAATDGAILALVIDAPGLADSPWPKSAHDVRGTGDARRPLRSATGACLE